MATPFELLQDPFSLATEVDATSRVARRGFRLLVAAAGLLLAACGASIETTPPVNSPGILVLAITPGTTSVTAGAQVTFTASIQNAPANFDMAGLTWTLSGPNCVGATCGVLSTGTGATVTYTAPTTAPGPDASVTLQVAAGIVRSTATFVVADFNGALLGDYAFQFFGFDLSQSGFSSGFTAQGGGIVGRFHADGRGGLSAIELDADFPFGTEHHAGRSGSYSLDANRRGAMTIDLGGSSVTFRVVVAASGRGRLIEFDSTLAKGHIGTGEFRRQDTAAFDLTAFSGDYAFGMAGEIPDAPGAGRLAIAGRFTTDATGALTSGYAEPSLGAGGIIAPTSLSAIDRSSGRATTTWEMPNFGINFGMTVGLAIYVVDVDHAFAITTSGRQAGAINSIGKAFLVGEVRAQKLPPGMPQLSGAAIYYTSGIASITTPVFSYTTAPTAGRIDFTPGPSGVAGTIDSGRLDQVVNGAWTTYNVAAGAYGVATSGTTAGRARLNFQMDGRTVAASIYLTGVNEGFVVGQTLGSSNSGEAGFLEPQSGLGGGIEGRYAGATVLPSLGSVPQLAFDLTLSNGLATGLVDVSSTAGLGADAAFDGTYAADPVGNGRHAVIITSTGQPLHGDFVAWQIKAGRLVLLPVMNNGGALPALQIAEQ